MVVSAMENACQGGHIEIVKYLMSIANTHGYDIDLIRVINVAMQYQHIHITRYLFEIIASTVTYKRYYKYILWAAVKHGCAEIADILIDSRNVDVNQSVCGRSLLSHAYVQSTVNKLLLAKADINPASSRSVLTAACDKLVPESVKALIEARAEVNSDRLLSSPLWSAMGATDGEKHADHQETVINLLLRAGARTRPLKGRGSILHDCIMTLGSEHALRVVSMHDPSLLECRDSADLTPLMLTTLYKLPSMVKALVDAGADAGAYSGESTPLIFHLFTSGIMAWTDKLPRRIRDTLRLLLDAGADPMACDGDDNTLLTVCMGCDLFMHASYDCTWVFVSDILAAVAAKLQFPDTSAHLPV
jgi:ankyrin repeat protein